MQNVKKTVVVAAAGGGAIVGAGVVIGFGEWIVTLFAGWFG